MDRVQRSGVITLALLLLIAVAGLVLGPDTPGPEDAPPQAAVLDSDLAANLTPPDARRYTVTPTSFYREPIRHPLEGGGGRDVNAPVPEGDLGLELDFRRAAAQDGFAGLEQEFDLYWVREGDSLSRIAREVLGDPEAVDAIMALNGIRNARSLRIGQKLKLPRRRLVAAPVPSSAGETRAPMAAPEATAAVPATYVVKKGDTASEISQAVYGTSKHWRKLLAANGIRDPKDLRVGQKLTVPGLQ